MGRTVGKEASSRPRLVVCFIALLVAAMSLSSPAARAAAVDPQSVASSLQSDPVQTMDVPRSNFSALSNAQIDSLRAEIAAVDLGRIWILVVSPRGQASLDGLADQVYGDLPAGTLVGVAEDLTDPNTTHFWVGSTWQQSDAAQAQLNDVIMGYHKGQGSLYDDLRLVIQSFARSDAAAGRPGLESGGSGGQPEPAISGEAGNAGLIVFAVLGGIMLLAIAVVAGRYARARSRASHRRREETTDAHERTQADFSKLAEEIEALDVDSSMPNASPAGKDAYTKALDCYEDAERRMDRLDDEYQYERAVAAITQGLEHVHNADRLLNPQPRARHAPVTTPQGSKPSAPGEP